MRRISKRSAQTTQNLSKEQLERVFKLYDSNNDGSISKDELKNLFDDLGALTPSYRADRAMTYADANKNGLISFDELKNLLTSAPEFGFKLT